MLARAVTAALVVGGAMLAIEAAVGTACLAGDADVLPARLSETGLYFDIGAKQIARDVIAFEPQYPLWTDGAAKQRWIRLPAGTSIDARDPDHFVFPVGTKLWKEFAFGARVETRFMRLGADRHWRYATYVWNADQKEALLAPVEGVRAACTSETGVAHDVPSRADCTACHGQGAASVLGFDALQLSSDRDPLAPHAKTPAADQIDLAELVRRGLVHFLPQRFVDEPPRIVARSPRERAVLGYLDSNCGACHTAGARIPGVDLDLSYSLANAATPAAIATTVERPSHFRFPGDEAPQRITPGSPETSVLARRMASRQTLSQMPPLGSHAIDAEALALVRDWIREDLVPARNVATNSTNPKTR